MEEVPLDVAIVFLLKLKGLQCSGKVAMSFNENFTDIHVQIPHIWAHNVLKMMMNEVA